MEEAWSYVLIEWASGRLKTDVVDPKRLLTPELAARFADFDRWIWAVSNWDSEVPSRSFYPFPIMWKLMTE